MNATIRIASAADLPAIDEIYNQAVAQHFQTGDLQPIGDRRRQEWFDAHNPHTYPIYLYEENGSVLGWLSLSVYRPGRQALQDVAELSYYVALAHQGKGIGTCLLDHAISESRCMGKRVLFAVIIDGNAASLSLLKKFGFEKWGYLPEVISCYGEVRGQVYLGRVL